MEANIALSRMLDALNDLIKKEGEAYMMTKLAGWGQDSKKTYEELSTQINEAPDLIFNEDEKKMAMDLLDKYYPANAE